MRLRHAVIALLTLVVIAHVFLWLSDQMPFETKWRLTVINALGWAAVLIPAYGVGRWLDHRFPDRDKTKD
ncbi:MAG: phenylalanyl-tRNA synthetase subunit beta [Pseudomonadota bacterium]